MFWSAYYFDRLVKTVCPQATLLLPPLVLFISKFSQQEHMYSPSIFINMVLSFNCYTELLKYIDGIHRFAKCKCVFIDIYMHFLSQHQSTRVTYAPERM